MQAKRAAGSWLSEMSHGGMGANGMPVECLPELVAGLGKGDESVRGSCLVHRSGSGLVLEGERVSDPGPGAWLAEMDVALVCASDLHTLAGRRSGPSPCILGHETVSTLVAAGPGAPRRDIAGNPLMPGDRVAWAVVASCGDCGLCRAGWPQKCVTGTKYGHVALGPATPWSGGFASHQLLRSGTSLLRVPDGVPSSWAAMVSCSTATVAAVLRVAGEVSGRRVLVNGGGNLGTQAVLWALESGASEVWCAEPDPVRRAALESLGARGMVPGNWDECAGEFDVFLELAGQVADFGALLGRMAVGGVLVLAGAVFPGPPVDLDMEAVVRRCLTVRGMHNYAPSDLVDAMGFLERHWERLGGVVKIAPTLPLDCFEEVLELSRSGRFHRAGFHGAG